MTKYTEKLNLFQYEPESDGKKTFNIKQALNDNFDKLDRAIFDKQDKSNFSQTLDTSTTKYPSCNAVKTAIDAKDSLPSQTGNAGKFLTTDGTNASWKNSYTPPLLSCMWSDHLLSDMSWLRADTFSWQDGTTYSLIYNELLSEYNNSASTAETEGSIIFKRTPKGYKIANSTQETAILNKYNSNGIAWYYILDTENQRFKLPRTKYDFVGLRDSVGGYVAESLPNITGFAYLASGGSGTVTNGALTRRQVSSTNINTSNGTNHSWSDLILDASGSSNAYQDNAPVQQRATQMYLYFYVGNHTQSAIQQTAGINAEMFNGKADVDTPSIQAPYLKTTYLNGASGYNIWSNGYCEQWGRVSVGSKSSVIVTLLKAYSNLNYKAIAISIGEMNMGAQYPQNGQVQSINSTSQITVCNGESARTVQWETGGYLAEGEY